MIETIICKREGCNNPVEQKSIGPYKKEYCSNACKQAVYRASHRNVTADAQSQQRIAELEQELAFSQRNLAAYQEKVTASIARIQRLESQVETQRLKLKEAYHSKETRELVIVHQEQELARYARIVDLTDRQKMAIDFLQCGELIGYRPLLSLSIKTGLHYWQEFLDSAADEELAGAIVVARHVWKQGEDLKTIRQIEQQEKIITKLKQELEACKRKQA